MAVIAVAVMVCGRHGIDPYSALGLLAGIRFADLMASDLKTSERVVAFT